MGKSDFNEEEESRVIDVIFNLMAIAITIYLWIG
jgi:hypothetical protein